MEYVRLYGSKTLNYSQVVSHLSKLLHTTFYLKPNSFGQLLYYDYDIHNAKTAGWDHVFHNVRIENNYNPFYEEIEDKQYSEYKVLVYVSADAKKDDTREILAKSKLEPLYEFVVVDHGNLLRRLRMFDQQGKLVQEILWPVYQDVQDAIEKIQSQKGSLSLYYEDFSYDNPVPKEPQCPVSVLHLAAKDGGFSLTLDEKNLRDLLLSGYSDREYMDKVFSPPGELWVRSGLFFQKSIINRLVREFFDTALLEDYDFPQKWGKSTPAKTWSYDSR